MNARQRRALKRIRPAPGARIHFRHRGKWTIGTVSRQGVYGLHVVRIDFDNGDYRTWGYARVRPLKPHPDGFYTPEEIR